LQDRPGVPCRVYEVLPEERAAICRFAMMHSKIGYRKLTWMMVDAGIVCVGESTVYRVLSEADLLSRSKRSQRSSGEYHFRPTAPNQQWHTDVMYVWVAARFYFLLSFVDAFSGPVRIFVCEAYHDDEQESVCQASARSPKWPPAWPG
jgi:hypothetical protein